MKRLASPALWLPLLLLILTLLGAILLYPESSTTIDARSREFYSTRHFVHCALHALSAAAGCGLFTYAVEENFTADGRSILLGIGLSGAVAYVAAFAQSLRAIFSAKNAPTQPELRLPHPVLISILLIVSQAGVWAVSHALAPADLSITVPRAIGPFSSLGWYVAEPHHAPWLTPAISFLGAISLPFCLGCLVSNAARPWRSLQRFTAIAATYLLWLAALSAIVCLLETRRSYRTEGGPSEALMDQPAGARFARSIALVVSTAGGGITTEPITDRGVSDATKALLATTILVGGLPGSPVGGMTWLALLLALGGAPLARKLLGLREHADHAVRIASTLVLCEIAAALVAAFGLLLIEHLTAAYFQAAPSFANALLDGCALVGGASLTSGLAATVTSENLSSGMRQSADLYLYGTAWMMLAMLIGRALPVWILCRAARPASLRPD